MKNIELIHVSTSCVYGDQRGSSTVTEESIPNPTEIYATQKLQSENILMKMVNQGLCLSIARLGTVYGGQMRPSQVMYRFLSQNLRGEPIVIHGDGNQERVYTYMDDVVKGLIDLIENEKRHIIYNICSEKHYSVNEIADSIEMITGISFKRIHIDDRPGQIYHQPIKAERMANEYTWSASTSLQEGLQNCTTIIQKELENEVFNDKIIPCVHRIHAHEFSELDGAHLIQKKLGFSISDKVLKEKLLEIGEEINGREKLLVTFDDGYADVLLMERFFDDNPSFQPVIFYPTSLFENKPLWFDIFYSNMAKMETEEINEILQTRSGNANELVPERSDAINKLKEEIRNKLPEEQIDTLTELFGKNVNIKSSNIYLQKKDLRHLVKKGWSVGSHSRHHYNLTRQKTKTLEKELLDSLKSILEVGGRAWLAYPDGRWNPSVKNISRKVGYKCLFTLHVTSYSQNDADHFYRTLI